MRNRVRSETAKGNRPRLDSCSSSSSSSNSREFSSARTRTVQRKKMRFLKKVLDGKCDYALTNEQLEAMGSYEGEYSGRYAAR